MPALASFAINDGAATPASHTFSPTDVKEGLATWHDRSGGIVIGYPKISTQLKFPSSARQGEASKANRVCRVSAKVVLPVLEVTSPSTDTGIQPAPTKAYDVTCNMEFLLPERSTLQDRKHILAYVKNFLNTTLVTAVVQDLEAIY